MTDKELTVDEIFEIGHQREQENRALKIAKQGIEENKEALEQLAEIEHDG